MILDQCYVINEIISLCKESHYQDVTIICQNGAFSSNSFLLAAIFPIFRNIMKPLIEYNDSVVVSVPDLDKNELESFCHSLYSQNPKYVSKSIIHQLLKNYIKEEFCNEDVPDYSSVDIDPDNAELNIVDEINEDYEDMHKDPVVLSLKKEKNVHNIKKTILNGRKSPKIAKRKSVMKVGNKKSVFDKQDLDNYVEVYFDGRLRKYKCKQCGYDGCRSNIQRLHSHCLHKHFGKGEVSCHVCGKTSRSKGALEHHMRFYHSKETFCKKCHKRLQDEEIVKHECPKYICNECGKIFLCKTNLTSHTRKIHENLEEVKPHICSDCGKGFKNNSKLQKHMETHEEKKSCPECGFKVRDLRKHMQNTHIPEEKKNFRCQHCSKGFFYKHQLDQHLMNMHLKLKPYNCRYGCDLSYNDISNRNQHEKRRHGKLFTTVEEERSKARLELSS